MKTLLVLDPWYKQQGGANKNELYNELSKIYNLRFIAVKMPKYIELFKLLKTFHPKIGTWKEKKSKFDEYFGKLPYIHKLTTNLYNKNLQKIKEKYELILQIGGLFGPVDNSKRLPYFSYHDSAIKMCEFMWQDWLPVNFSKFKLQIYTFEKNIFDASNHIFTYSQFTKDFINKEYGIDAQKISAVGSALKIPQEHPLDWSKRNKDVLFISTDFVRKGGYEVIEVFKKVIEKIPDARLVMVGKIPADVEDNPYIKKIKFLNKKELIEIYKSSTVLLHPAKYDPFPSVILEASNFEIPCIASNVCGIPEQIKDGKTGFVLAPEDKNGFVEKLVLLLKDKNLRMQMGKAARERVKANFYPDVVAKNIATVIDSYCYE